MKTIRTDNSLISADENSCTSTIRVDSGILPAEDPTAQGRTVRDVSPPIHADDEDQAAKPLDNDTPSPSGSQTTLNVGDVRTFNNRTYSVVKILSQSSGEAEVYLLSRRNDLIVFKWYFQNFRPKDEILNKLRCLEHPNIVNIQESSYYERRFYELQDYAPGGSLDQYLPIKDPERIKQIIMQTVNALKCLHGHGIIHKDIKPANLYCKNSSAGEILVADFGISSMLDYEESRLLTSQGLTIGYAAPEMYGIGNKMIVGREVDYYALGVSIIHIWQGKSPFYGLEMHSVANLTTTGKIELPEDLPKELEKFIKGSITIDYEKRWGYDEVQRWLNGEDVPVLFQYAGNSAPYLFEKIAGKEVTASTPEELATLLERNPEKGIKQLYGKTFCPWLQMIDPDLNEKIIDVVELDYPKLHNIGLKKAKYLLAPNEPYKAENGTSCRTPEEIAKAFEEDADYYARELADRHHSFYLYLEARDEKQQADSFHKIFSATSPPERALNTLILELLGNDFYRIGNQEFTTPDQLLACRDDGRLKELLQDEHSTLIIWMQRFYKTNSYLETMEAFVKAAVSHDTDLRKKIYLSNLIAACAVKCGDLISLVRSTSMLENVYPDHPLLKRVSSSISEKIEQLRQQNKLIANSNSLSASKPKAELVMLLFIPLAIGIMPLFHVTPGPLVSICLNSYPEIAACYLAGIMLVLGTLLYADYRKLGVIGWLAWAGIIAMLAAYFSFAKWALVLLLSFFPASALFAVLFVPNLHARWKKARNLSKSARQNQLLFSDQVRLDAYREGVANFFSSDSTRLSTDSVNRDGTAGVPSVHDLDNSAAQVSVPERSIHLPTLLVRGVGVLAASAAVILSAKVYFGTYDKHMNALSTSRIVVKAETATVRNDAAMRLSASATSKRVTTVPKGSKVRVLGQNNEWTHVAFKDFEGHIKNSLLQMNK